MSHMLHLVSLALPLYLGLLALAALSGVLLNRLYRWWWHRLPDHWAAGPRINWENRSPKIKVRQRGEGCEFDWIGRVNYLTRRARKIGPTLRFEFEITGTTFIQSERGTQTATITPHFQRRGDDWSAKGDKQFYRWWAPAAFRLPITPGRHVIEVPVNGDWISVYGRSDPNMMQAALNDLDRVGLCFGGPGGLGHGAHPVGPAHFRLISVGGAA